MQTLYSRSFFALQIAFARRVAIRFSFPLADALWQCTTFARESIGIEDDWDTYTHLLAQSDDPLEVTYRLYLERRGSEPLPQPNDATFFDHPLFGCFYFTVRDTVIRPHFINNDLPGTRPLSRESIPMRHEELRRLFTHVRRTLPATTAVAGNSWLYNLPAYRRLFPPTYTLEMNENTDAAMHMIGLWGQCFDRFWEVKPEMAAIVMERVEQATDLATLRFCFPYQRLRPTAPLADFYTFYGIAE